MTTITERLSACVQLAMSLMARESVTPNDAGCQAAIAQRLQAVGFRVRDYSSNGVTNTWYEHGQGNPVIVLCGHTDVVPPGPDSAWQTPAFSPSIRDGKLFGRGACDMKGAVAAMVCAAEAFVQQNPQHAGTLVLALTSDEEGPATDGMKHLVEQCPKPIHAVITGEPTCVDTLGDTIKNGRRGSLHGHITLQGKAGHVAYPEAACNVIHHTAPIIEALTALHWPAQDGFPETRLQITRIDSDSGATNVIPDTLTLRLNCRYGCKPGVDAIQTAVRDCLANSALTSKVKWEIASSPFMTPPGLLTDTLSSAITTHCPTQPTLATTGGTSDSRFWATVCEQVVDFGPVNTSIHQVNEWVDIAALDELQCIYTDCLQQLLDIKPPDSNTIA